MLEFVKIMIIHNLHPLIRLLHSTDHQKFRTGAFQVLNRSQKIEIFHNLQPKFRLGVTKHGSK